MKRVAVIALVLLLALLAIGTLPAMADVHAFSQAGCAPDGVASGAIGSRHAIGDPGRPAAPIMISASPFSRADFPGRGGDAPAQGTNC